MQNSRYAPWIYYIDMIFTIQYNILILTCDLLTKKAKIFSRLLLPGDGLRIAIRFRHF